MTDIRRSILIAAIAFASAIAGVLAGRELVVAQAPVEHELHDLLHQKLDLDASQHQRLEVLEKRFAVQRQALELELRAGNARLAAAIEAEHGYGPRVSAEVDRSHKVMGELQKETLEHVFEMRAILRPDQAPQFDEAMVKALTATAK